MVLASQKSIWLCYLLIKLLFKHYIIMICCLIFFWWETLLLFCLLPIFFSVLCAMSYFFIYYYFLVLNFLSCANNFSSQITWMLLQTSYWEFFYSFLCFSFHLSKGDSKIYSPKLKKYLIFFMLFEELFWARQYSGWDT